MKRIARSFERMCYKFCHGAVVLFNWHLIALWLLSILFCACFAGVWILDQADITPDIAALLGVGVVMTSLMILLGIGYCCANTCRPHLRSKYVKVSASDSSKIDVSVSDDATDRVLADLEAEMGQRFSIGEEGEPQLQQQTMSTATKPSSKEPPLAGVGQQKSVSNGTGVVNRVTARVTATTTTAAATPPATRKSFASKKAKLAAAVSQKEQVDRAAGVSLGKAIAPVPVPEALETVDMTDEEMHESSSGVFETPEGKRAVAAALP